MKRKNSSLDAVQNLFLEFSSLDKFQQIEWIEADLLDIPSLTNLIKDVETIYHTAAVVSFNNHRKQQIHEVNVTGTENLVNSAILGKVKNFIYTSSIAVLDKLPSETIISEESKWDSEKEYSEYAISKKKGEMTVWRGSQEGLDVLVIYPSVVIGSQDGKRASERLFQLAAKKKTYISEGTTGYVDVRDVAFSIAELVEQRKFNQSFILTSENKSFVEVFDFLRSKWGMTSARLLSKNKLKLIQKISQFGKWFGLNYMSKANYYALTDSVFYSNQKVKDVIGIEFFSVEEALEFHSRRYQDIIKSL